MSEKSSIPYSEAAEKAVLGSMMAQPEEVIKKVLEALRREDFFIPAYQEIFVTLRDMDKVEQSIDVMTIHQWLVDRKLAESLKSPAILAELLTGFATHLNVDAYIKIVREKSLLRCLQSACATIEHDILDMPDSVVEVVNRAQYSISRILKNAGNRDGLPEIEDGCELSETPMEQPNEIVQHILHQGSKLVFGGSSKSFKTWCLLQIALSISGGRTFWDFQCQQARTLYINLEIQRPFFATRIKTVREALSMEKNNRFDVWNLRGHAADIDRLEPVISKRIEEKGYALIVVDPIYKMLGDKDENSAQAMSQLMNALDRIAVQSGAAIAFGAHFSKGNQAAKEAMDRISGSGVFGRDPDVIVTMTALTEPDCFSVDFSLRNLPPIKKFAIRRTHPLMIRDYDLDPENLREPKNGQFVTKYDAEDALGCLIGPMTHGEWLKSCVDKFEMSKPTFSRIRNDLLSSKTVSQSGNIYVKHLNGNGSCP